MWRTKARGTRVQIPAPPPLFALHAVYRNFRKLDERSTPIGLGRLVDLRERHAGGGVRPADLNGVGAGCQRDDLRGIPAVWGEGKGPNLGGDRGDLARVRARAPPRV